MSEIEIQDKKSEMIFQYMLTESRNMASQESSCQPIFCYKAAVQGVERFLALEKKRIELEVNGD